MRTILTEKALKYAKELVKIESVTFREKECAQRIEQLLRDKGFEAEIDDGHNLVARLPGIDPGAPALLFIGHHDTVELGDPAEWDYPPLAAVVENGKLHGRGSNDEKGGLAAFLAAVEYMQEQGVRPRGDILLVSTREEIADLEKRGILQVLRRAGFQVGGAASHTDRQAGAASHTDRQAGAASHTDKQAGAASHTDKQAGAASHTDKQAGAASHADAQNPTPTDVAKSSSVLLQTLHNARACLCLEPTETRIMLGHRGRAVTDFIVSGRAAHASMPARGINAIAGAAELITAIQAMPLPAATGQPTPTAAESVDNTTAESSADGQPSPAAESADNTASAAAKTAATWPPVEDWTGTQAVTMISGGTRENIIPEECRFSVDRRILDGEDEYTVAAEYQAIIDQLRIRKSSAAAFESKDQAVAPTTSRSKGAVAASAAALSGSESEDQTAAAPMHGAAAGGFPEISFHIRPPYYAALTDREEGFVREVRSILRDMRVQDEPQVFPGHTDAEWVINDMGIPCVIFGPGSLSTAHTAREYVPVEDLGICAELYYRVMRK